MRIEDATKARVFTIFDAPKLDPITVTLQDVGPGAGRLIVECWGEAWAAYWGGMGNATLAEFVADCGTDYITTKLTRDRMLKREVAYLERIVAAVQAALRSNAEITGRTPAQNEADGAYGAPVDCRVRREIDMPWIDVTERMPDEYDTVLIGRTGVPWPITGFWTGEKWVNRDVREEALDPTHWMPLPPGPVDVNVRPKTRGYTEARAKQNGMNYEDKKHCPECGCPWYGNKNDCGIGHRTCCDCYQEWWTDIEYDHTVARRELPAA